MYMLLIFFGKILYEMRKLKEKNLELFLIFANKTEVINNETNKYLYVYFLKHDILLKKEIDEMKESLNLKTIYVIERLNNYKDISNQSTFSYNEKYEIGLITPEIIQNTIPDPSNKDILIIICGSKTMTSAFLKPMLTKEMKYDENQIYSF
jgi:NAD(P)H-flavin reductase